MRLLTTDHLNDTCYPKRFIIDTFTGVHMEQFSPEQRLEQMVQHLKDEDNRITPQRLAVLKVLAYSNSHPSAETIYSELIEHYPTMSLATVYKTIALLKQKGEVLELEFSDLGNRYDGKKPYSHPHVICTGCGTIIDPSMHNLEDITQKMAKETGFKIMTHRLDFYGLCPDCQKK
jgi:Fur family peroxide stress response transcriptional regulator